MGLLHDLAQLLPDIANRFRFGTKVAPIVGRYINVSFTVIFLVWCFHKFMFFLANGNDLSFYIYDSEL